LAATGDSAQQSARRAESGLVQLQSQTLNLYKMLPRLTLTTLQGLARGSPIVAVI
jgi:hypothetical protein